METAEKVIEGNNNYLLCPFDDDVVEAHRVGLRQVRADFLPHIAAEAACNPDLDPLLSTQCVRRWLYRPFSREGMQQAVVKYYGWEEWSEDPWGSYLEFIEWLNTTPDNEMVVWAINETKGRFYLRRNIFAICKQWDFSQLDIDHLHNFMAWGTNNEDSIRSNTGWSGVYYPEVPFPSSFLNQRIGRVYPYDLFKNGRFEEKPGAPIGIFEQWLAASNGEKYGPKWSYQSLLLSITLSVYAAKAGAEIHKDSPENLRLIDYTSATTPRITEMFQRLAPEGMAVPEEGVSLEGVARGSLKGTKWWWGITKEADRFMTRQFSLGEAPFTVYEDALKYAIEVGAGEAIGEQVERILEKPEDLLDKSKKKLTKNTIKGILKNEEADEWREENPWYVKFRRKRLYKSPESETDFELQLRKLEIAGEWEKQPEYKKDTWSLEWEQGESEAAKSEQAARQWEEGSREDEEQPTLIETLPDDFSYFEEGDTTEDIPIDQLYALVERADLTLKQHRVVELKTGGKISSAEIAAILEAEFGKPYNAAAVDELYRRAEKKLREAKGTSIPYSLDNISVRKRLERQLRYDPARVRFAETTGSFIRKSKWVRSYVMPERTTKYFNVLEAFHRVTDHFEDGRFVKGAIRRNENELVRRLYYQGPPEVYSPGKYPTESWEDRWEAVSKSLNCTVLQLEAYVESILVKASVAIAPIIYAVEVAPSAQEPTELEAMIANDLADGKISEDFIPVRRVSRPKVDKLGGMNTLDFGKFVCKTGIGQNKATSTLDNEREALRMEEKDLERDAAYELEWEKLNRGAGKFPPGWQENVGFSKFRRNYN